MRTYVSWQLDCGMDSASQLLHLLIQFQNLLHRVSFVCLRLFWGRGGFRRNVKVKAIPPGFRAFMCCVLIQPRPTFCWFCFKSLFQSKTGSPKATFCCKQGISVSMSCVLIQPGGLLNFLSNLYFSCLLEFSASWQKLIFNMWLRTTRLINKETIEMPLKLLCGEWQAVTLSE